MTEAAQKVLATLREAPGLRARQGRYELRFARTQEELDVFGAEEGASGAARRESSAALTQ